MLVISRPEYRNTRKNNSDILSEISKCSVTLNENDVESELNEKNMLYHEKCFSIKPVLNTKQVITQ